MSSIYGQSPDQYGTVHRARARQPRLLGVLLAIEGVSRAVTTQAERADCRPRARASE